MISTDRSFAGSVAFRFPPAQPCEKGGLRRGSLNHFSRREPHDQRTGAECAPAPAVSAMDSRPTDASDSHPEKRILPLCFSHAILRRSSPMHVLHSQLDQTILDDVRQNTAECL